MLRNLRRVLSLAVLVLVGIASVEVSVSRAAKPTFELKKGDRVSYIGNTLADRMQHHGWLETYLQALHPEYNLTFRNLGFSADEITVRPRSTNFGSADQWLTKTQADVVFCFFGYNEAFRGEAGLQGFRNNLAAMIDGMRGQQYNGHSAPRLVLFSPIAHEDLKSPHLPDGKKNNKNLALYTNAMRDIAKQKSVSFVDLFTPTLRLYANAKKPLTMNGIHMLEHGNRALAEVIVNSLYGETKIDKSEQEIQRLRSAVLDRNLHWFSRYRVVDGYNVYGGRSRLAWFGQSNADVMKREMEIFDVKTANRDKRVWAVAQGSDYKVLDNNLPKQVKVKTNKPGKLDGGSHPYLSAKDSAAKMKLAPGMQVNVFASEKMFPELVNPVQMAVDTDGRLFVSVWPSYPHWNPTKPRRDRILCLPDENGDGVADKCIVFADKLNSITAIEFWGGGLLVAAPPEIWFLKDTNGDDKADVKIRMLQGISSADTHHSANAMVLGPDGWLYWSRGIFNTASMETPTKTYRSKKSGVHRFNPRTFEMEFHFPIGPNPHGDVFDQWGFQFANDGTSGTGSYVNLGKGIGNKKWFKKRVRPVAAIGILSSSHFPAHNNGNFLICNTIGFLGVLQHKVTYNGADITATEIEPILVSSDQNFRPTDIEIGGDGALYVSDWCNVLIGHMQHNMRDPNRDHKHGRIYRVTYKGRPLVKRVKLKGKPIEEVCHAFFAKDNGVRYRARIELSGRESKEVATKVLQWASQLNPAKPDEAQALLECLWVFEEHRMPNTSLLQAVLKADDARVRAAAIRTLGHWHGKVEKWQPLLIAAARDKSALVRAEAVKAAVEFEGLVAAEVVFEVATRPVDPELTVVLNYARGKLNVDKIVQDALKSGKPLSTAAQTYVLRNASVTDLLKLERTEAVYRAILSRTNVSEKHLSDSLTGLAKLKKVDALGLLLDLIDERDAAGGAGVAILGRVLSQQPAARLKKSQNRIERLALKGRSVETKRLGYAAWITASGSADDAFLAASQSKARLRDFLEAVPSVTNQKLRGEMYAKVRSLVFQLPINLKPENGGSTLQEPGVSVDFYSRRATNAAKESFAKMKPRSTKVVPSFQLNSVRRRVRNGAFSLRFTGAIQIPRTGRYTFYTNSDDGSRLYIGGQMVVNNDGNHGPVERSGQLDLPAGIHPIVVTYFNNGGGNSLRVSWSGPGLARQEIPANRLSISGGETLHDVAVRALSAIPGHEAEKVTDLAALIKAGKHRMASIGVLRSIPQKQWPQKEIQPLVDNLVGYLSQMPARYRTSKHATETIALVKTLAARLKPDQSKAILSRLQNLNVRVIAIGTVPHRMIYDKERIVVQAGKPVEFRFSNSDNMPHNFAIVLPGSMSEIGLLAEATARDADAMARHYIPKSNKILLASRLLQPGESQALAFIAPKKPGVYPYVCTYPGHWRRMYGVLYVVEDPHAFRAGPDAYLASHKLTIKDDLLKLIGKSREWKVDELLGFVKPFKGGRSFEVGENAFKMANCIACHQLGKVGRQFGPDLTKLESKKQTAEHILRSMITPSKNIDKKYQSHTFLLESGKILSGMVIEETASTVKIIENPLAKSKSVLIKKSEIEFRKALTKSIMPVGLASRLTREEILDLIAYVLAKGKKDHMLFHKHKH